MSESKKSFACNANTNYITAIYVRLSSRDRDINKNNKDESNSISNQRALIHNYIKNSSDLRGCKILEFCDEGHTGTTLNRPAFQDMLKLANEGSVNCIIVKDFSRFARDHIEIGHHVEQRFPCIGVRFISVCDGFDSVDLNGITPDMGFCFTNLTHELFCDYLSQNVISAKITRAKMGKYINNYAPYGYKKSALDHNKLEVDTAAARIVKRIFQMRLDGESIYKIARILNSEGLPTPGQYKALHGSKKTWQRSSCDAIWDDSNIKSILRDERYIGNCVFGKRKRYEVGGTHTKAVPRSEWIIVEGTHEAIISKDEFDKVQASFPMKIKKQ